MSTIGKVRAVFTASTGGLTSGVNQAAASMRRMQQSVSGLRSGMNTLVAIQGAQFFASMASSAISYAQSLVSAGNAQAQTIDRTAKLANRLGLTYAQFTSVALAGDLAGVSMEEVGNAATRLNVMIGRAANGSASAAAAFEGIGLSVADLQGMSPDQQFAAIADAIGQLPTAAARAAAAVAIFGKAGASLLPMFEGGGDAIRQAAEQAERLGLSLTEAQSSDVQAMNDAFTLAYKAVEGIVGQVTAYLSPAIKNVADTFTKLVGDVGGANIGQAIGDAILNAAVYLAQVADSIIAYFSETFSSVESARQQWENTTAAMAKVGEFFKGVWYVGEAIFKGVAALIMRVIASGAKILDALPDSVSGSGWDAFAADLNASASNMSAAADQALVNSVTAFDNATSGVPAAAAAAAGEAAGPLESAIRNSLATAQASAAASGEAVGQAVAAQITDAVASAAPQQLKGVDSRSAEGVAEVFRLMRGGAQSVQDRIATASERTAEAVEALVEDSDLPFAIEGA